MFDSNKNENSQRQTYIVISIPGLNEWAKERNTNMQQMDIGATHNSNISKRSLDNDDVGEMDCSEPVTKKEKVDYIDVNMCEAHCSTKVQNILSEDHILNFPIPIDGGKACMVKV